MKRLGIALFLSTACSGAVGAPLALAPLVAISTLPQAGSWAATEEAVSPKVFKNTDAGIQFELPAGWTAQPEDSTLTITSPDSSVSVVLWALESMTGDDALKSLRPELEKTIKNQKVTKPAKKDILNGMPVTSESGTGEVEGTTIEWTVDLITAKKPVIYLLFAAPGMADKHADEIAKFRKSIKKLP